MKTLVALTCMAVVCGLSLNSMYKLGYRHGTTHGVLDCVERVLESHKKTIEKYEKTLN